MIFPIINAQYKIHSSPRKMSEAILGLAGERMVFSSAEVGSRAEALLAQRREKREKKRWLLAA